MLADSDLVGLKSSAVFSKELIDLLSDPECHHLHSRRAYVEDVC